VADQRNVLLVQNGKLLPVSHSDLPLDKVLTSDHLGDRVFDLQPSVHLHEVELVSLGIKDELNSTSVVVSDGLSGGLRSFADLGAQGGRDVRGTFLNNLLMSSLHCAISFVQVDVVAVFVTKYLHFDVSGLLDVLLDQHVLIVEALLCFSLRCLQHLKELTFILTDSHSFAAATKGCFEHDGESDTLGLFKQILRLLVVAVVSREDWNASFVHDFLGLTLRTH